MIVELTGVGKRYTKFEDAPMLATAALRFRQRTRRSVLWAVRSVDLTIDHGECVGVIGRNGSGKSTLLSMLAGVTAPTEGRVTVRGRVAPLISVGVGFHPELTGRENVYVNGMILGMSRREVDASFDEIVAFSEVEEFIDTPVKFYSSGMFVRLGFAVAVQARPDLLLVDEVLAVGDLAFQMKCYERMMSIRDSGATIVLVSHNLNAIERICGRALVVNGGAVVYDGPTAEGISRYQQILGDAGGHEDAAVTSEDGSEVRCIELHDAEGVPTRHLRSGQRAILRLMVVPGAEVADPILGVGITTADGTLAYSDHAALDGGALDAGRPATLEMEFEVGLVSGSYRAALALEDARGGRIATSPSVTFYVTGASVAHGVADLGGRFRRVE